MMAPAIPMRTCAGRDSAPFGREGEEQRAAGEDGERENDERSLAVGAVDDSPGEWARGDGDEASEGECKAGVAGVPVVGGEVSGEKRTDSGLNVGDEEVKPFERADAFGRWAGFGARRDGCLARSGHSGTSRSRDAVEGSGFAFRLVMAF